MENTDLSPKATTVGLAVSLLEKISVTQVCWQLAVDDSVLRAQLAAIFQGSQRLDDPLVREAWLRREQKALDTLNELLGRDSTYQVDSAAWREGQGSFSFYVPGGLDLEELSSCLLRFESGVDYGSWEFKLDAGREVTQAGVLTAPLTFFQYEGEVSSFFSLGGGEQAQKARRLGADGICSVEEMLYLLLRYHISFGRRLQASREIGQYNLRGRNVVSEKLMAGIRVSAKGVEPTKVSPDCTIDTLSGAVPRFFVPIDA